MLTRKELSALWQCIEDSRVQVQQMKVLDFGLELIESEKERLKIARKAYIKVKQATHQQRQDGGESAP